MYPTRSGEPKAPRTSAGAVPADQQREEASWDGLEPRHGFFHLMETLSDVYSAKILAAASQEALTTARLSRACGIPIAATYRRIRTLESAGLLSREEGPTGRNGRKIVRYRSLVRFVAIVFQDGQFHARVELGDGAAPAATSDVTP